jgi:PhnB protein
MGPTRVSPYLIVADAAAAIDFYRRGLGAEEIYRLTGRNGRVGHAELRLGASVVMLADEHPEFGALSPGRIGGTPVQLHLQVADVDAVLQQAVEAGATVLRPARDEFYGERTAMIADPSSHVWHLATIVEAVSPDEMQRRWTEAAET